MRISDWSSDVCSSDLSMHYQTLLGECADRILTVTLNRPAKLNAMSATMLAELRAVFSAAATDPAVSVVVLRASGRAFTVGYDLNEPDWLISQYPANRSEERRGGKECVRTG